MQARKIYKIRHEGEGIERRQLTSKSQSYCLARVQTGGTRVTAFYRLFERTLAVCGRQQPVGPAKAAELDDA